MKVRISEQKLVFRLDADDCTVLAQRQRLCMHCGTLVFTVRAVDDAFPLQLQDFELCIPACALNAFLTGNRHEQICFDQTIHHTKVRVVMEKNFHSFPSSSHFGTNR